MREDIYVVSENGAYRQSGKPEYVQEGVELTVSAFGRNEAECKSNKFRWASAGAKPLGNYILVVTNLAPFITLKAWGACLKETPEAIRSLISILAFLEAFRAVNRASLQTGRPLDRAWQRCRLVGI